METFILVRSSCWFYCYHHRHRHYLFYCHYVFIVLISVSLSFMLLLLLALLLPVSLSYQVRVILIIILITFIFLYCPSQKKGFSNRLRLLMDSFIYLFRILANCYAIKIIRNITDQMWGKCAYGLPGRGNQLVPCRWNLGWMRCWDRRRVGLAGRLRLKQIYHALFFGVSNSRLKPSKGFRGKE